MSSKKSLRTHWCLAVASVLAVIYWFSEAILHSHSLQRGAFRAELLPLDNLHELWTRLFILSLFVTFGIVMDNVLKRLRDEHRKSEGLVAELTRSLAELKTLSGLLPICAVCKKVRDDTGYWQQVEMYIRDRTDVEFTHGYCPSCVDEARQAFGLMEESADTDQQCAVQQETGRVPYLPRT